MTLRRFSNDGKWYFQISSDNRLTLWDTHKGQLIGEHTERDHLIAKFTCVAFQPNLDILAKSYAKNSKLSTDLLHENGVEDEEVKSSKKKSRKTSIPGKSNDDSLHHLNGVHDTHINGTSTKSLIAIGTGKGSIVIWDPIKGEVACRISTPDYLTTIDDICFAPDFSSNKGDYSKSYNHVIACSSSSPHVCIFDVQSGSLVHHFEADKSGVNRIALSLNGEKLATGRSKIKVWNTTDLSKPIAKFSGHPSIRSLSFTSNNQYLLSSSAKDSIVNAWSLGKIKDLKAASFALSSSSNVLQIDCQTILLPSKSSQQGKLKKKKSRSDSVSSVTEEPSMEMRECILAFGLKGKLSIWLMNLNELKDELSQTPISPDSVVWGKSEDGQHGSVLMSSFAPQGNIVSASGIGIWIAHGSKSSPLFQLIDIWNSDSNEIISEVKIQQGRNEQGLLFSSTSTTSTIPKSTQKLLSSKTDVGTMSTIETEDLSLATKKRKRSENNSSSTISESIDHIDDDIEDDSEETKKLRLAEINAKGTIEKASALSKDFNLDFDNFGELGDDTPLGKRVFESAAHFIAAPKTERESSEKEKMKRPDLSSANSLASALAQALASDDRNMLESCLQTSNSKIINSSIQRLPVVHLLPLLSKLIEMLEVRPGRGLHLLGWIRSCLEIHSSYLTSVSNTNPILKRLQEIIRARVDSFGKLLEVSGKLDFVISQASSSVSGSKKYFHMGTQVNDDESTFGDSKNPFEVYDEDANAIRTKAIISETGESEQESDDEESDSGMTDDEEEDEEVGDSDEHSDEDMSDPEEDNSKTEKDHDENSNNSDDDDDDDNDDDDDDEED